LHGERAAVLEGVVLGEETGLSEQLRQRFRAAGLYHLLAVSGQNVALVAGSVLLLAWLVGVSRLVAELRALAAVGAYVLAVGPLLGLALAGTAIAPFSTGAASALAWANGWCAAYLAAVARLVGGLPFAQIQSTRTLLILLAGVLLCAAYASPRWRPSSSLST